jgi:benzil reductase ((S)-benzoin forming)
MGGPPRSVVLTGVSRGLGAALFDQFVGHGDRMLAVGRGFTPAQLRLAAANADRVRLLTVDLADFTRIPDRTVLRDFLEADSEAPAVLVHNAAVVEPLGAIGTVSAAEIASAAVNLTAAMVVTNAFLAARQPGRPARILFVSSRAAQVAKEGQATYCASKSGGEMFFESVAREAEADPWLRVVTVRTPAMDTGMQAAVRTAPGLPDRDHFIGRYQRGELADPAAIARGIIADHLVG